MFNIYDANGPVEAVRELTAVTVGVFDGVHCGHKHLLGQLADQGERDRLDSMAVTLTAHPSFVLGRKNSEYWLDDPDEHLRLLFEAGMKYVAVLPFSADVARLTACQMAQTLFDKLNMRSLFLGYDSRFGSKLNDDFDRLPSLASKLGFSYSHGEPYQINGLPVSSSRIRNSLVEGRVNETCALLGRPYSICGKVLHGRGVGHTIGFPTANIDLSKTRKMLPKDGVYAVQLSILNSQFSTLKGMANLGPMPTFGIDRPTLEVHLIDFDGDLYGQTVEVQFLHRIRDIVRFNSPEALQRQLKEDLNNCLNSFRHVAATPKP